MTHSLLLSKKLFFEPWGLGDAIIAARVASNKTDIGLCIKPQWHPIVNALYPSLCLLPVSLDYTSKQKKLKSVLKQIFSLSAIDYSGTVISIRGDIRDRIAMRRMFPKAKILVNGYYAFTAKKIPLLNLPVKMGLLSVINRYDRWCYAAKLKPLNENSSKTVQKPIQTIAIHIGTSWLSKRYPWWFKLGAILERRGYNVYYLYSPEDRLARSEKEYEEKLLYFSNEDLVSFIRDKVDLVIVNDSAPMHLASALNKKVLVFSAVSNIEEWLPPGPVIVLAKNRIRGYAPLSIYKHDDIIPDNRLWFTPEETLNYPELKSWLEYKG